MATAARQITSGTQREDQEGAALLNAKKELEVFRSEGARAFIEPRLSPGISFYRVVSEVYSCISNNPKLAESTPASLINAVARACQWGLPIGELVFIVPFKKKGQMVATAILGYRGAAHLVVAAGGARMIKANPFYANEPFQYEEGTNPYIRHTPIVDPKKRGPLIGGYAWAGHGPSLPPTIKVMHRDEIDSVRMQHSKSWAFKYDAQGNKQPLPLEEILWYVEKTPILRLVKTLPSDPVLARLAARFDVEEQELPIDGEFEEIDAPEQPAQPRPAVTAGAAAPVETRTQEPVTQERKAPANDDEMQF